MKLTSMAFVLTAATLISASAFAAKSYQVTGEVTSLTDTMIVVKKGKETFEIDRGAQSKVTGDLKVGGKVTVYYTMSAAEIEAKAEKKK